MLKKRLFSGLSVIALMMSVSNFGYAAENSEKASVLEVVEYTVNINSAGSEELSTLLTGIGDKKAESIIRYREEHGPFGNIDELQLVKGIGPSLVDKNREHLVVE